jgi:hypothetical protein
MCSRAHPPAFYNGGMLSIRRHMTQRNLRSYTFAHAVDDGQDALVAGRPATVQNSYAPNSEKGPCVTDQRHRFAFFYVFAPWPFHRDHEWLARMFNNWKTSGVVTFGSGRPISANRDRRRQPGWQFHQRPAPGVSRNSLVGPDYATAACG